MNAPLETLAAHYWAASRALRGRGDVSRATAALFLASQASHPRTRLSSDDAGQALAVAGLGGVECLRPHDGEPAA